MRWLRIASLTVVGLVLAIFALMGLLYSTRGTSAHRVRAFADPDGPPAAADSTFVRTVELLTHTRIEGGHVIELLLNADQTYPRMWDDMRSAQRSINFLVYYGQPGQLADSLKRILSERARAGVHVRLLLDAFGAGDLTADYLDSLRAAGVRTATARPVRWYTLHKAQNRLHTRALIVDESVAYTGGFGIADQWLSWRETNARFTGPAVAQLQALFAISWVDATGELLTGGVYFSASDSASGQQRAGLLYASPTVGSTSAKRFLAISIAAARVRLYIANPYFLPDEDLRGLITAATRRGVDVRVLTASRNTDVKIVRHASHALYEELLRAGVRIFEYQPAMMHAKTMVIDGIWATVGSMNIDNRSISFSEESNLLVWDTAFARQLEHQFITDLRRSNEFKLEHFTKRSLFARMLDGAAWRIAPLL